MSSDTNSDERPRQAAEIEQQTEHHRVASAEDNRLVARRWIDAFNARDDAAEAAARTADYVAHAPDSIQPAALDGNAWVEFLGVFLEGFPDLHLEVQDSAADGEMVAQRILFTGTHTGSFRGLPPTNRQVRFSGLEINRMVNGKVAEHWFQLDAVTLFEQLGLRVVPGPRLLPRLMASQVTRLLANRRRMVPS
ncbi:MAG TPA: ester cyclase [Solirubrobacteraceae bacterium]|jgi:predicted ester cyclase|nr:ester cyclase [Solirubrobacteraceae bacterium]